MRAGRTLALSLRGVRDAGCRRAASAAEGEEEEGQGRQGMALNSCVGSQVRARTLRLLKALMTLMTQVLNLLLGVGLPCFISAAVSGQGGSVQVSFAAALPRVP